MSALTLLGVGLLGGAGALARFVVETGFGHRIRGTHPWGTLTVNLTGAFALGVVVGAALDGDGYRLVATGFLGAYTTFSTWMLESDLLHREGRRPLALANLAGSLAAGLLVVWLGRELGQAL